jgi:hypothetical protein
MIAQYTTKKNSSPNRSLANLGNHIISTLVANKLSGFKNDIILGTVTISPAFSPDIIDCTATSLLPAFVDEKSKTQKIPGWKSSLPLFYMESKGYPRSLIPLRSIFEVICFFWRHQVGTMAYVKRKDIDGKKLKRA